MQTPPPTNSRKRPHSDQQSFELGGEAHQTVSKKQKENPQESASASASAAPGDNPSTDNPSTDNPLTTPLTVPSPTPLQRHALKALRQQVRESRASQRIRRPATRLAVAEWKKQRCHQPPLKPADTYIKDCGQEHYKALLSFAKHGGPDLRDLRGRKKAACHPSDLMDPSQPISASRSTKTKPTEGASSKSLSPYNRSFEQALIDHQVYPPRYRLPDGNVVPMPGNWDSINERLAQRRRSLSPSKFSKEQYVEFADLDINAAKEIDVKRDVMPIIQGKIENPRTASGDIPFTNLAPLAEAQNLVPGNPDLYHGARPEQLDRGIRDELEHYIVPSTQHDLPILPNHVTAVKGPDGSMAVARRQAIFDGHFGARAINALQSYGKAEPQFDGNAYAFSCTYCGGQLILYTSHPAPPANPGGRISYYMNLLGSFSMVGNEQTFRTGATWYRNSIELAREMRNEFIRAANEVRQSRPPPPSPPPFASNIGESFASAGIQLGLDSLAVDSQAAETALSITIDDHQTAEASQDKEMDEEDDEEEEEMMDDEDEARPSHRLSAKRSAKPLGQKNPRKIRRN